VYYLFINNKNLFFLINFYPVKNFATFFQKHRKALPSNVLEMGVAPNSAKMRFRPQGGIAFLPPDFPQPYSFSNSNKATCKVYEPCRLLSKLYTHFLLNSSQYCGTLLLLLWILKRKHNFPYRPIKTHISLISLPFSALQSLYISCLPSLQLVGLPPTKLDPSES